MKAIRHLQFLNSSPISFPFNYQCVVQNIGTHSKRVSVCAGVCEREFWWQCGSVNENYRSQDKFSMQNKVEAAAAKPQIFKPEKSIHTHAYLSSWICSFKIKSASLSLLINPLPSASASIKNPIEQSTLKSSKISLKSLKFWAQMRTPKKMNKVKLNTKTYQELIIIDDQDFSTVTVNSHQYLHVFLALDYWVKKTPQIPATRGRK